MQDDRPFAKFVNLLPWVLVPALAIQILSLATTSGFNPDEHIHAHFMWLLHRGLRANIDFLLPYPSTFYRMFDFLMNVFPLNEAFLPCGRVLSLFFLTLIAAFSGSISKKVCGAWWPGVIGILLPAAGYIETLRQFRPDTFAYVLFLGGLLLLCRWPSHRVSIGFAAFLAVLSAFVMPKHIFLVAGAAAGFLYMGHATRALDIRKSLLWAAGGLFAALVVFALIIHADLPAIGDLPRLALATGLRPDDTRAPNWAPNSCPSCSACPTGRWPCSSSPHP